MPQDDYIPRDGYKYIQYGKHARAHRHKQTLHACIFLRAGNGGPWGKWCEGRRSGGFLQARAESSGWPTKSGMDPSLGHVIDRYHRYMTVT